MMRMNRPEDRPCPALLLHLLCCVLGLALAAGPAVAQDSGFRPYTRPAPPASERQPPASAPDTAAAPAAPESTPGDALPDEVRGETCSFGCLRWTQMCNVDPRGVYRCQRGCARMGQVCQ